MGFQGCQEMMVYQVDKVSQEPDQESSLPGKSMIINKLLVLTVSTSHHLQFIYFKEKEFRINKVLKMYE